MHCLAVGEAWTDYSVQGGISRIKWLAARF